MMKRNFWRLLAVSLLVISQGATVLPAAEVGASEYLPSDFFPDHPEPEVDLTVWDDPVINRMVDIEALGIALAEGDATTVADVALQLAEAERVLLRNHPQVTSAALLKTALTMAQNSGDKETFSRLKKAAVALGNKELQAEVQVAMSLGDNSRGEIAPPAVAVDTDPEQLQLAQQIADQIRIAESIKDGETLQGLRVEIAISELPESVEEWLNKLIDRAEKSVGEGAGKELSALSMLAGASRGWWQDATGQSTPSPIRNIAPNGLSVRFRPHEPESHVYPGGFDNGRNSNQPASSRQMRDLGYRKYNNVQVDSQGAVRINGKIQQGRAQVYYNSQTGQNFHSYRTPNGGRIVRQSNGNVWVRPAQPRPQFQPYNNRSQGGRQLGTIQFRTR